MRYLLRVVFLLTVATTQLMVYGDDAYQLLRESADGYSEVKPGRVLVFPRDHLSHADYRIEWWYLTGNLEDSTGHQYGIHWTLFRMSLSPQTDPGGWSSNQMWMAHSAVSLDDRFVFEERFARGGIGQADVAQNDSGDLSAWLDNWSWQGTGAELFPGVLKFTVADDQEGELNVELHLQTSTPWVLQGQGGYSQKSERGQASYYYSQPHIQVTGSIVRQDEARSVKGKAWLDREWSSQPLADDQPGWDWFSLHLDDGSALMVYRLRQLDGDHWLSGSLVSNEGEAVTLLRNQISIEPLEHREVATAAGSKVLPLDWQITIKHGGTEQRLTVSPPSDQQWLDTAFPYWEGPVNVTGAITGKGFMELTGY